MLGSDTRRRLSAVEQRLGWLDEHGTRGVDGLRVQIVEQAKDLGKVEQHLAEMSTKLDGLRSGRAAQFGAYALAIIPVYVLLFLSVFGITGR